MEDLNSVGEQRPSNDDGDDIEKTTKKPRKFKKAPGAPKRFRSGTRKSKSRSRRKVTRKQWISSTVLVRARGHYQTTSVAKIVSEEWRTMGHDERSKWEKLAQLDKERFENEKATYRGPWTVPIGHRKSKDPSAPKRPASAFLAFSNSRRASVKKKNPDATNAEVSRALSKMWKEAPEEIRKKYTDEEAIERKEYKVRIADWRQNQEENQKRARLNAVLSSQQGGEVGVTSASTVSSSGGHHNAVLHAIRGDSQRSSHDQAPVVSTGTPQAVGSSVAGGEQPGAIGNHQHPFVLSGLQPNESTNILMNNLLQLQNNNQAVGAPWDGATSGVNQNLAAALGTNVNALSDIERLRYVLAQQQSMATIQQELTGLANAGSSLLDQQYDRGSHQAASTGGVPGQADNHQQWLDPASLLHRLSQQANAANPQTQTLLSFGVPTTHVNDLQQLGLLVAPDQQLANPRLQPESVPSGTIHSLLQLQQALAAGQLPFDTSAAPALQDGRADDPESHSTSRIPKRGRETDMGGETTTSSSSTSQNNKISRKGLL
eukprot:Nitzschia sp. Nitz4//scaffold96_size78090//52314//54352//NITZ4_005500-RA/size78090-snap-gene-0.71-mRNA-1//-1//CDS//3329560591//4312//frame0